MIARNFFQKLIEEMPSRGMDDVDIHISSVKDELERDSYRIVSISNDGSNDGIFIVIEKM